MSIVRINVGPIHPSTHGVLRLVVDLDGDTIVNVEPHIGFLHRGVEKLMENRMYMQSQSYTEKLDYLAPFSWDELYTSAVEQAMKKEVKPDAQILRVIMLEYQRIASHLVWLGTFCNDIGQIFTIFMWSFRERARILKLLEDLSGTRMFYVNLRLGGFYKPLPKNFKDRAYKLNEYLVEKISEYKDVIEPDPVFNERTKNIGVLPKDKAIELGVAGPVLRASGVRYDIRKAMPYYIYDKLKFKIPIGYKGDNFDRYKVRYEEIFQSIKIIDQALDMLPDNPDILGQPIKLINPNANPDIVVVHRELPKGEGIIYMVPDKQRPYRISLRAPSFINTFAINEISKGYKYADLFANLGSLDIVLAEIDR
ncbi:MAG: NADH-quinone oxidoreductase subunit D [Candidatus Micrarchaeota archaeon]|nr:MAG: NADH-quinone oxidoreductase subunit D [Candidatus Micrarchaeota archaeon]